MADTPVVPLRVSERDELLLEMRDRLVRVEAHVEVRTDMVKDHESRIRGLERWRYGVPGAILVALVALLSGGTPTHL